MKPPPPPPLEKPGKKGSSSAWKWILAVVIVMFLVFGAGATYFISTTQKKLSEAEKAQKRIEKELAETKEKIKSQEETTPQSSEEQTEESSREEASSAEEPTGETGAYTPPRGSTERQAILDAVRDHIGWEHLFIVHKLKVKDNYAYGMLEQYNPDRPEDRYESFVTLLRKIGDNWECLEAIGGSDLVAIEEDTGLTIEEWLQDRYPDAPSEIFE